MQGSSIGNSGGSLHGARPVRSRVQVCAHGGISLAFAEQAGLKRGKSFLQFYQALAVVIAWLVLAGCPSAVDRGRSCGKQGLQAGKLSGEGAEFWSVAREGLKDLIQGLIDFAERAWSHRGHALQSAALLLLPDSASAGELAAWKAAVGWGT